MNKIKINPTQAIVFSLAMFIIALVAALFELGRLFGQSFFVSALVAIAVPSAMITHAVISWTPQAATRMAHGFAFVVYLIIVVSLSTLYVLTTSSDLLRRQASDLVNELFSLGQTIYSSLFGICLVVTMVAVVVDRAAQNTPRDDIQATMARMMPSIAIGLAIVTSAIHLFDFGARVAAVDLFSRLSATVMADVAFLAVKANISTQLRSRAKTGIYDVFDLVAWSAFGLIVAGYLVAINAAAVAAATASDMNAFREQPIVSALIVIYGMSPTVLLAGLATLSVLTGVVDLRSRGNAGDKFRPQINGKQNQQQAEQLFR
jgi:hypothetical protein